MKRKPNLTALGAAISPVIQAKRAQRTSSLYAGAFSVSGLQVDEGAGIIRNCAVMTEGPTLGHGFSIDATTLTQAQALINSQPDGVKVRFSHPEKKRMPDGRETMADDIGTVVGRLLPTTRIEGNVLRGDIQLGAYAETLPGGGNAKAYLIGMAKENPSAIGLSVVMLWSPEDKGGEVVARLEEVWACDFVGKPAANPNGLLSANTNTAAALASGENTNFGSALEADQKGVHMDPKLKAALVKLGLNPDANDDQARAFMSALTDEKRQECEAMAAEPDGDEPKHAEPDGDEAKMGAILANETKRVAALNSLGQVYGVKQDVVRKAIADNLDLPRAKTAFLKAIAEDAKPVAGAATSASIHVGEDRNIASLKAAIPTGLAMRAGYAKVENPDDRSKQMASLSIIDMGRQYLAALGADVAYVSRPRMAELLLSSRELRKENPRVAQLAESTGDFSNLLLDAIHKTFRPLYLDAPKTWPAWARRVTNPDFKNINRVAMSEVPSLTRRDEGGEITYKTVTDGKETYTLAEYVGGVKITRKAIINDDLDAFGRIPQLQANSCWRQEDSLAYGVLTANAALGVDSTALFYSTHSNLVSTTSYVGAPTVANLSHAEGLMLKQKGPKDSAYLGLTPKFIISGVGLKTTIKQLLTSADLISVISTTSSAPQTVGAKNPYAGAFTQVWTPFITSATAWYLAADYRDGQIDTVEVAFLDGEPEPVLRQETDFDSEDVKFAVRHTCAAKAIDFRGLVYNPGA